jgi:hypothetical protein
VVSDTRRRFARRLPCCYAKPTVHTEGHETKPCKCGFVYRCVFDGDWIKWERVIPAPKPEQLAMETT